MTAAESPGCGRRRIHLRSLSDVTGATRGGGTGGGGRARSLSERAARLEPRSHQPSPSASLLSVEAAAALRRHPSDLVAPPRDPAPVPASPRPDPWRKMSASLERATSHDPWIRNVLDKKGRNSVDLYERVKRSSWRRGKLERRAGVEGHCTCAEPPRRALPAPPPPAPAPPPPPPPADARPDPLLETTC